MDFYGTTTPTNVLGTITSGVTTTIDFLFPFFIFLGVFLAFVIVSDLIRLIKNAVTPGNLYDEKDSYVEHNEKQHFLSLYDEEKERERVRKSLYD